MISIREVVDDFQTVFYNPTFMYHFILAMMIMVPFSSKEMTVSIVHHYVEVNKIKKKNQVLLFNHRT